MFQKKSRLAGILGTIMALTFALFARPLLSDDTCTVSRIILDASSAERIYLHPEKILEDIEGFWQNDRAYWLTSLWHKDVGYPAPPFGWDLMLMKIAKRSPAEREQARGLTLARDCIDRADQFSAYVIPYICSFLPRTDLDISSTIYLTAAIVPHAFQKNFDVVINLEAINGGPDEVFNTLIHELFHVGYYRNQPLWTETLLDDETQHDFIYSLQNEGMATYVAYLANSDYPSPTKDYTMLEDSTKVQRAIASINSLYNEVLTEPEEAFRKSLHETGVNKRALYIAGAHMARTIDQKLGRATLVRTISVGPRDYISTYNGIASADERIREFDIPQELTKFQRLHRSVVDRDYATTRGIIDEIRTGLADIEKPHGHILQAAGQLTLHRNQFNLAVEIFRLYSEIRPDHPNPFAGLMEAYYSLGDLEETAIYCRKVLDLAPGNARARQILTAIE